MLFIPKGFKIGISTTSNYTNSIFIMNSEYITISVRFTTNTYSVYSGNTVSYASSVTDTGGGWYVMYK
jgi:hypothetical protein